MKSKILTALLMLLPFTQLTAYIDEDDGEVVDQFMLTMGTSGYILCKAIDMARENGFRFVKILSAEYSMGNQSGGFTCQLEEEGPGRVLNYEDEAFKMSISCLNVASADTDYIDTDTYQDFLDIFDEDGDDGDFMFGQDDEDE